MICAIRSRSYASRSRCSVEHGQSPRRKSARSDRLRPLCQAWGGARALNGRWSKEADSLAATDHGNISVNKRGARIVARIGTIIVPARLILAQMAQKSPAGPVEFFCGDDGETSVEASRVSAAAQAVEPLPNWPA